MRTKLVVNALCLLISNAICLYRMSSGVAEEADFPDPPRVEALLKTLDPFYTQHVAAAGLVIVGSEKVSPRALREVAYLANNMLVHRPDVKRALAEKRTMYICVMAHTEMQTDLPECRRMDPWWDYRARGLGGRPCSCGEENVLCLQGDPWKGESIFIHEFAHGLHGTMGALDRTFEARLRALYDSAKRSGRFKGYAIEGGVGEFWAEGVQAWFDCNGTIRPPCTGGQSSFEVLGPRGEHVCHITAREQVQAHLPEFAKLLDESFKQNAWRYVPVAKRLDEPHLRGFDPAKAPVFRWPAKVVEAFYRAQTEKSVPSWAKVSSEQIAIAKKLAVPVAFENAVGMRFVLIPPETFRMGSRDPAAEVARRCAMPNAQAGWFHDEHPQHAVTLTSAFYLSVHEVTQGVYEAVVYPQQDKRKDKNQKKLTDDYDDAFKGKNKPVVHISWDQAKKFCDMLKALDKREYALPTEAQWEYACRAGTKTPFAFGETVTIEQANYHGGYIYGDGRKGINRERPVAVGTLAPNAWGLYDMHGNVSEWCADLYGAYSSAAETDPQGSTEGRMRVVRGGSWRSYPGACRSAFRLSNDTGFRSIHIGFRVCCAVAKKGTS